MENSIVIAVMLLFCCVMFFAAHFYRIKSEVVAKQLDLSDLARTELNAQLYFLIEKSAQVIGNGVTGWKVQVVAFDGNGWQCISGLKPHKTPREAIIAAMLLDKEAL